MIVAIETYANTPPRPSLTKALLKKMPAQARRNRPYRNLVNRFGEDEEIFLRTYVVKSLHNMASTFTELGNVMEAIAVHNEIVRRFSIAQELPFRTEVLSALYGKGVLFGKIHEHRKAVAAYDQAVEHFGEAEELVLREQVAKSLFNKGCQLNALSL